MTTADFIREHHACRRGAEWALSISDDMADVWDAMIKQNRHDWLVWTATRPGGFSDSILRKLACRFIRETPLSDGCKVWDLLTDERSRKAVEVAESYVDGKATYEELEAAFAAAFAAADAAYAAAARAAAYDTAYDTAYDAACNAARVAAYAVACNAVRAARAAAYAAADDAAEAAYVAARVAAKAAQVKLIAELGNPFKEELGNQCEQKHTPGPWIATRILGGWWIEEDNDPTAFYRRRIAGVAGGAGIDSPAANARLLAAAPELLAALEEAKQFIQNGIEYGYINTPEDEDVLARIKKAIRKAKGVDQ